MLRNAEGIPIGILEPGHLGAALLHARIALELTPAAVKQCAAATMDVTFQPSTV